MSKIVEIILLLQNINDLNENIDIFNMHVSKFNKNKNKIKKHINVVDASLENMKLIANEINNFYIDFNNNANNYH